MNLTCLHPCGSQYPWLTYQGVPFYHTDRPSLVPSISDQHLALAAPVIAYWVWSLVFHCLDISGWEWLDRYRIHPSDEVQSRNRVTPAEVVRAVFVQHALQTALGLLFLADGGSLPAVDHRKELQDIARILEEMARWACNETHACAILNTNGSDAVYFIYWWAIPTFQFFFAMFFIDTWQYFLHRLVHTNKFLYKHLHSVHHRLYVPYAFGALYNHPIEGLLMDSLGAVIAEALSFMTNRQATLLFSFSTFKTVDDHCGYNLPFDPLQLLTRNNADYHDIHHQIIGAKSNFSQPFFVHWDVLLGTRLTREDIELRRRTTKTR